MEKLSGSSFILVKNARTKSYKLNIATIYLLESGILKLLNCDVVLKKHLHLSAFEAFEL